MHSRVSEQVSVYLLYMLPLWSGYEVIKGPLHSAAAGKRALSSLVLGQQLGTCKEKLHDPVCRKIGNCDTLCWRKDAERHNIMEKHRFQGDERRELYHEALYRRRKDHINGKERPIAEAFKIKVIKREER